MNALQVEVDNVRIAYTDRGAGAPVLFMHGNPDSRHSWEPVIERLGEGIRVIAPDFPGFGESEPLPDDYDLLPEGMAGLWNRFADAAGLTEQVVVAVHDFGGPWLLPWVAAHSDRVRGVLILNTLFQRDYKWHAWARVWQRPVLGELAMWVLNRPLLRREMRKGSPELPMHLIDATYDRIHPTMKRTVLRVYRAYANPGAAFEGWEQRLAEALATIPTRVIWGNRDPYIGQEFADRHGVEAVRLPDHGHWHHMSNPDPVAQTLRELVRD